jgi:inner membrane protein
MDNLTHTLFGLALAKTGLERTTPQATAAILIGANFPDIDLVTLLGGSITYLKYHRGITHSITGILVESLILALMLALGRRYWSRGAPPGRFAMLYLMAVIGMGSHFALDYCNSYGIRPFLPFNGRWYAADLVFIVDPWMLTFLMLGLGFPFLFRLIQQEIGARPAGYRLGAALSLLLVIAFWGGKYLSHRQALDELQQRHYEGGSPIRLGALPHFLNPAGWYGIVETSNAYHLTDAGHKILSSNRRRTRTLPKSSEAGIVEAATQGDQARIFLDFARYPLVQVNPMPNGYEVIARDLRFDFATRFRRGFLCTVLLDKNLKIVSEQFRF